MKVAVLLGLWLEPEEAREMLLQHGGNLRVTIDRIARDHG